VVLGGSDIIQIHGSFCFGYYIQFILYFAELVSTLYGKAGKKKIILCDYNYVEYDLMTDDDLLSSVATVKRRKNVILTGKRLFWENGPFEHIGTV
jgi:hypothetical protein